MTQNRRLLLVDAFTDQPLTGNAAGVVPNGSELSPAQMQAVARELSVSETAFVRESTAADREIRYFTPTSEVDLCGHATIAAHAQLYADGEIAAGSHTFETQLGVLDVEVTDTGLVWFAGEEPTVSRIEADIDHIASILGVPAAAIAEVDLPVAVASTGLPFVIVPITFLDQLGDMDPDMSAIEDLANSYDAAGVYAFTFDTLTAEATVHGRCFVPGAGVPEDPVTGTASGAAAAYLNDVDAFDDVPAEFRFEQGHFLDRPGTVRVESGDTIRVGGHAVQAVDGTLSIPSIEEDEIIES